jgi:predicted nucleic acid-binding protein
VTTTVGLIKDDPTDNMFLACALDGQADYVVSGDHHLLSLGSLQGIGIVSPRDFLLREAFL